MRRITLVIAMLIISAGPARAASGIAYVDLNRVWTASQAGKSAEADLKADWDHDQDTIAAAKKTKGQDVQALQSQASQLAQNRRAIAVQRLRERVTTVATRLRAERRLHEVRLVEPQTLSVENDITDEVVKRLDAEDKASVSLEHERKAREAAEAKAADLQRQLAAKAGSPPEKPAK